MEVFWKQVKGELQQQLMFYEEDFNLDLMHQGEQKVEQYTSLKMSPTASQYISLHLCHPF